MKIALVYHSGSGNTKALAMKIASFFPEIDVFTVTECDVSSLEHYDVLLIGTYTWGNGDVPLRVQQWCQNLKYLDLSQTITGIFGTGETNYAHYCGAVNGLAAFFSERSQLKVTLKVEQMYQDSDLPRIQKFCEIIQSHIKETNLQ